MRMPSDLPRRGSKRDKRPRGNRGRIVLIVIAAVLVLLFLSARGIAGFFTDYLWFSSLGYSSVFTGVLGARIVLAVLFTALFFVVAWVNLWVADRLAPTFRLPGPEDEFLDRYQRLVARRAGLVRVVAALAFALIAGVGVNSQWRTWLLFTNSVPFGAKDPLFDTDVSFYVFRLPFLTFLVGWLFASLVIVLVITAVAHYLNGGIRLQVQGQRVTPQVKAHLSVLLGLLAVLRAGGYWLERYELTFSRGLVDGAGYTDVNARLPALMLLVLISLFAAALLLFNIRRRGWVLPAIAVGLWGLVAAIAGAAYPTVIQNFFVSPQESNRERLYIQRNIDATRAALGLDEVEVVSWAPTQQPTIDAPSTVAILGEPNVQSARLVDPTQVLESFQLRRQQNYYSFNEIDVDRYTIDGETRQVAVGVREISPDSLPNAGRWEIRHLTYTHGYGIELAPTNSAGVDVDGNLVFLGSGGPEITRPEVYFGENLGSYAVVNTAVAEVSLSNVGTGPNATGTETTTRYQGTGGVRIDSVLRRLAFALRFSEPNMLLSRSITDDSKILFIRDVRERVEALAPFLSFDTDPYPVVVGGRIKWVVDGYTTTDRYPYAQFAEVDSGAALPAGSGLRQRFNYVRNSVKAVVDAYDGTVDFYVIDEDDPLVKAYDKAFPELFKPRESIPPEFFPHFRYPEDLFRVQTNMWGRYRLDDPLQFYQRANAWTVAPEPPDRQTAQQAAASAVAAGTGLAAPAGQSRVWARPYYQSLELPGSGRREYLLTRPFVGVASGTSGAPGNKLTAIMSVSSEPDSYGRLRVLAVPQQNQPDSPFLIGQQQQAEGDISSRLSLLDQAGSQVTFGNMLILPLGLGEGETPSLLWVRPVYVRAAASGSPRSLEFVIVSYGGRSVMRPSLSSAISALADKTTTPPTGGGGVTPPASTVPPSPTTTLGPPPADATVQQLLDEAERALAAADAALARGSLADYQANVERARQLIIQARGGAPATPAGAAGAPTTAAEAPATTAPSAPTTAPTEA